MTSLYLSCATSTTAASRHPFLKPPHVITTHAKPSHPLHKISCSSTTSQNHSDDTKPQGGKVVDRRNVLLGMGGLYGAANLVSGNTPAASANPILPPELNKCGTATNWNNGESLDGINCCPPLTTDIIDYKLPPVFQMKIRPSAHRVSAEYMYKYNLATDRMRRLPADDPRNFMQQANIHCAYCNGAYDQPGQGTLDIQIHKCWLFFPFHRWYLYFYERILGKLIGDPTFALPFWNWDNPKGMTIPPMFVEDPRSALYDRKRNQKNVRAVVDLGLTDATDTLQLVSNNLTIMHNEMIRGISDPLDFMGARYSEGTDPNPGEGSVERGSHTSIHAWVGDPEQPSGEDLGNFYSAGRDPLFYCHHANVDRMWFLWQRLPNNKLPDKRITDPDYLNASFLFYDENAQLVKVYVRDTFDNRRMGFDYERVDLPWMDYRPPPQAARTKINKVVDAPNAKTLFPLKLDRVVRFQVDKTKKGKADEILVLENITVDASKLLKFDVFVNDEDDNPSELDKASYLGTYAQLPHKPRSGTTSNSSSIRLKLTDLYDDIDIGDDDAIVVTLVPRHRGPGVTIGGIKIIENPTKPNPTAAAAAADDTTTTSG
ncbi:hypothetical protein ACP275_13G066000 [Erythranthe tilingii]